MRVLVKKTETMLIVYKNKLKHFVVCIRNSIFAMQKVGFGLPLAMLTKN